MIRYMVENMIDGNVLPQAYNRRIGSVGCNSGLMTLGIGYGTFLRGTLSSTKRHSSERVGREKRSERS